MYIAKQYSTSMLSIMMLLLLGSPDKFCKYKPLTTIAIRPKKMVGRQPSYADTQPLGNDWRHRSSEPLLPSWPRF